MTKKKFGVPIDCVKITKASIGYGLIALAMMQLLAFIQNLAGINLLPLYYGPAFIPFEQMAPMFLVPFLAGSLYALVYGIVRKEVPGKKLEKGFIFGFMIWLIATIPGMLMTLFSFNVPLILILDWTFTNLATLVTGGALIAYIYGDY